MKLLLNLSLAALLVSAAFAGQLSPDQFIRDPRVKSLAPHLLDEISSQGVDSFNVNSGPQDPSKLTTGIKAPLLDDLIQEVSLQIFHAGDADWSRLEQARLKALQKYGPEAVAAAANLTEVDSRRAALIVNNIYNTVINLPPPSKQSLAAKKKSADKDKDASTDSNTNSQEKDTPKKQDKKDEDEDTNASPSSPMWDALSLGLIKSSNTVKKVKSIVASANVCETTDTAYLKGVDDVVYYSSLLHGLAGGALASAPTDSAVKSSDFQTIISAVGKLAIEINMAQNVARLAELDPNDRIVRAITYLALTAEDAASPAALNARDLHNLIHQGLGDDVPDAILQSLSNQAALSLVTQGAGVYDHNHARFNSLPVVGNFFAFSSEVLNANDIGDVLKYVFCPDASHTTEAPKAEAVADEIKKEAKGTAEKGSQAAQKAFQASEEAVKNVAKDAKKKVQNAKEDTRETADKVAEDLKKAKDEAILKAADGGAAIKDKLGEAGAKAQDKFEAGSARVQDKVEAGTAKVNEKGEKIAEDIKLSAHDAKKKAENVLEETKKKAAEEQEATKKKAAEAQADIKKKAREAGKKVAGEVQDKAEKVAEKAGDIKEELRTGITMKANIKKDADGLDNIDDFWNDGNDDSVRYDSNTQYPNDSDQEEREDDNDAADNSGYDASRQMSPATRQQKQMQQQYLEMELPEELLSTPTSRRSRNVPISKGSTANMGGSARALLLPGGSMYDDDAADEYQSPSFHAIKKRLIFTKDSSDTERNQNDSRLSPFIPQDHRLNKQQQQVKPTQSSHVSSSPALDRLLHASQEKNAQFKANAAKRSPLTTKIVSQSTFTSRPAMTHTVAVGKAGRPKAFDFGVDLGVDDDDEDDVNWPNDDDQDPDDAEVEFEPRLPDTPLNSSKSTKPSSQRTPAEFRRKTKPITVPVSRRVLSEEEVQDDDADEEVYHEPEPRDENDDRLRFSDEDEPVRDDSADEEEEMLVNNHRKIKYPVQQKRGASTKEPKSTSRGAKVPAAAGLPMKSRPGASAALRKPVARSKKTVRSSGTDEDQEEEDDDNDDEGRVPSSAQKPKSRGRTKGKVTTSESSGRRTAALKRTPNAQNISLEANTEGRRPREIPLEYVEVPVVPDVGADDNGVRRSHRTKIAPLEFWKNERVIVGKDEDSAQPIIKAVLRATAPEGSSNKRKRAVTTSSSSFHKAPQRQRRRQVRNLQAHDYDVADKSESALEEDELDGEDLMGPMDEVASKKAEVLVFGTSDVASRVIAESTEGLNFRAVEGGQYQFHRGLEDPDSLASGTIKIKRGGRKPMGGTTNGSSLAFYVIKGLVQVTVNETNFILSTGGRFVVPRGNQYGILNRSKKESTLFFVQTKSQNQQQQQQGDTHAKTNAPTRRRQSLTTKIAAAPATVNADGDNDDSSGRAQSAGTTAMAKSRSGSGSGAGSQRGGAIASFFH
ncbi:hypothetical protein EDD11_004123 [Mortierella claussenii]|nr:hypothetical protein EDD11_004123 [Mortierella claussenii]